MDQSIFLNRALSAILFSLIASACSSGAGSSPTAPTTPTAAAPAGCSGTAIPRVEVNVNAGSTGTAVMFQLFGETFNQQFTAGQKLVITRSVVPCSYELVGQMLSRGSLSFAFSLTPPFDSRSAGVEKGSVIIDEGPAGVFGPDDAACSVRFTAANGTTAEPPYNIKIRFRVATSNAVDDRGGGCGPSATSTPAPVPTPTPTPTPAPVPGVNLSGTWTGTSTATIGNNATGSPGALTVVFVHSSSGLTGTISPSAARPGLSASFDLTPAFTGFLTIVFEGKTAVMGGSMQVNTSDNTMTGTFSGTNTDGLPERNVFSLRKQ